MDTATPEARKIVPKTYHTCQSDESRLVYPLQNAFVNFGVPYEGEIDHPAEALSYSVLAAVTCSEESRLAHHRCPKEDTLEQVLTLLRDDRQRRAGPCAAWMEDAEVPSLSPNYVGHTQSVSL